MRKEVIFAIFLGGFLGLSIAFLLTIKLSANTQDSLPKINTDKKVDRVVVNTDKDAIKIIEPAAWSVIAPGNTTVKGETSPMSIVILSETNGDYITRTDEKGMFSVTLPTKSGITRLEISSYSESEISTKTLTFVVFDTEKSLIAKAGTITDITDNTIQLKQESGDVGQVALSSDTTFTNTVKTIRNVTQGDVAIGDYIVVLGSEESKNTIQSQTVYITSSTDVALYKSRKMIVNTIKPGEVTGKNDSGDTEKYTLTDSLSIYQMNTTGSVTKLAKNRLPKKNDEVVVVYVDGGRTVPRSIFILPPRV